ncbi:AraC family transcriptional regulator [Chryseobacterium sp. P1-3]|uniref:AraC family transcriptional regulator n=1 Tax=Chryseobacterium gallinarum TaxID=1324352 RepID=A0A0G3MAQ0_CHRGL|nr:MULTISPECIES: AraC family transcriptional regulator [Chryseobacterium]AKK74132.1 AraC family transcriptional regulator [Chryseobacterium gallinarum]KFF74642.1 AraC family transcriptional regulator [Chryseobacterium sp. P1-3]QIY90059.1 AraC family transcriptional regulator [Chryseobacterium gallinarum]
MEPHNTIDIDKLNKPYFVWFEENWTHDDVLHQHNKGQLVYVESGFQYITIEERIYLLPQNHAVWIPPNTIHKTNSHSERIKLMIMFAEVDQKKSFYREVNVFSVPPVLREMIKYAEKWSKLLDTRTDETLFLQALFNELPHFVEQSLKLHICLPRDKRLAKVIEYLHDHYREEFKINELSDIAMLSSRTLERIFKKETGLTLSKYQQMLKIIKSLELLSSDYMTISETAYEVGYKSVQAYTRSFQTVLQFRPSDFIKNIK